MSSEIEDNLHGLWAGAVVVVPDIHHSSSLARAKQADVAVVDLHSAV